MSPTRTVVAIEVFLPAVPPLPLLPSPGLLQAWLALPLPPRTSENQVRGEAQAAQPSSRARSPPHQLLQKPLHGADRGGGGAPGKGSGMEDHMETDHPNGETGDMEEGDPGPATQRPLRGDQAPTPQAPRPVGSALSRPLEANGAPEKKEEERKTGRDRPTNTDLLDWPRAQNQLPEVSLRPKTSARS
jgi:hypothetical protein